MRPIRTVAPVILMSALLVSCTDQPAPMEAEAPNVPQFGAFGPGLGSSSDPGSGWVTIPFRAAFWTEATSFILDDCGPGIGLNTQEGEGNGTHIGKLTTKMVFCYNLNPGPDFGSYDFVPGSDNGYFTAANGDRLYITVTGGKVIFDPTLLPEYAAYFQDPFVVTGGTGRFDGATGGGMINSLVQADLVRTDHEWTGKVTVRRGQ